MARPKLHEPADAAMVGTRTHLLGSGYVPAVAADGMNIVLPQTIAAGASYFSAEIDIRGYREFTIYGRAQLLPIDVYFRFHPIAAAGSETADFLLGTLAVAATNTVLRLSGFVWHQVFIRFHNPGGGNATLQYVGDLVCSS